MVMREHHHPSEPLFYCHSAEREKGDDLAIIFQN